MILFHVRIFEVLPMEELEQIPLFEISSKKDAKISEIAREEFMNKVDRIFYLF